MTLYVQGPHGLGDNIYQRGVLNVLRTQRKDEIYVATPWPDLLPEGIYPVRPNSRLRTQAKNESRTDPRMWREWPLGAEQVRTTYGAANLQAGSILQTMSRAVGVSEVRMDLPKFPPWTRKSDRPIAVVRPATVRREWLNIARNPEPESLFYAASRVRETHHVIVVADIEDGEETLVGTLPPADEYYIHGELSFPDLMGLCQSADLLVGGVGWLVPFALAWRSRTMILLGGHGGHNSPRNIIGPLAPWDHAIEFVYPDEFCMCVDMRHECFKRISKDRIDEVIRRLNDG